METETPVDATEELPIETDIVRIRVLTQYQSDHSDPQTWRYVFGYGVSIENVGPETVQLVWRHWYIHDLVAGDHEVEGEGVVGESPVLGPGDAHHYQSFCVLRGPHGHMDGFYHFRRQDGSLFRAPIPRFILSAPPEATGTRLA